MDDLNLTKSMESVLNDEFEKYETLFRLSKEQSELFDSNHPDVDQIAELMNQKMEVIETLQQLQNKHEPIKERWKHTYNTFSDEKRELIAQLRDQMLKTIGELKSMEEQIAIKLVKSSQEVRRQLDSLSKGRQATRAYLKMDSMPPRFIDKTK